MRGKYRYGDENYDNPICPVCGWECEVLYRNSEGEIVGCDSCVEQVNAEDWWKEHEEELRYPNC